MRFCSSIIWFLVIRLNCTPQVKPTLTYSELFKQSKQGNQANNHADCQRCHAQPPLQLLLERGDDTQCGGYRACNAMQEIPAVFCGHLPASLALMRPNPAVTAANAPTKSGAEPLMSWMPTLESVATIVRMPSAVVFIYVFVLNYAHQMLGTSSEIGRGTGTGLPSSSSTVQVEAQ